MGSRQDTLEENQDLLLGKLSLTMLMMNLNVLNRNELKLLFDNDSDFNQVLKYPIIRKEDKDIDFIHNLFQENYCAKYLSTLAFEEIKKCITYAPEFEKIKPKWTNTIASIFNIIDESFPLFSNLLHFILESEPSLLVRFEYDKIDLDIRLSVFKTIMKDNNRYYQTFNFSELILFAGIKENPDVIKYILSNINSQDLKLTRDLIYFLRYADPQDPFKLKMDILETLKYTLSSDDFDDDIHEEALRCISTLNLNSIDLISWLFEFKPSFSKQNILSIVFKLITNL
ncbi:hypothetical protein [Flectobacillus longus]|uniref:hypothetical protein n=1 Tax=Flectobacillus longus TaxID=2984207 RepID=UPI0024B6B994|nr:hypothetical protein [Flectobacillus longus]MDI9882755.1 hypothetical protein [Flectobacillus longus]